MAIISGVSSVSGRATAVLKALPLRIQYDLRVLGGSEGVGSDPGSLTNSSLIALININFINYQLNGFYLMFHRRKRYTVFNFTVK